MSRFTFKADQDTWYLHRKLLAETGQAQSLDALVVELRCRRLDGTVLDVEAQSSSTSYDGKQVTITSLHDIGARKQADGVARPST